MRTVDTKEIADKIYEMALKAGVTLTPSCLAALKDAESKESCSAAKFALGTLLENAALSQREKPREAGGT